MYQRKINIPKCNLINANDVYKVVFKDKVRTIGNASSMIFNVNQMANGQVFPLWTDVFSYCLIFIFLCLLIGLYVYESIFIDVYFVVDIQTNNTIDDIQTFCLNLTKCIPWICICCILFKVGTTNERLKLGFVQPKLQTPL